MIATYPGDQPSTVPLSRRKLGSIVGVVYVAFLCLPGTADSFKIPVHEAICKDKLESYSLVVDGEFLAFTQQAISEIREANVDVDSIRNQLSDEKAHWHFDNEKLFKGSQRLINHKAQAIVELFREPPNGEEARKWLGEGMHTLQDFYSHSNWVNFNNDINTDLGDATKPPIPNPSPSTQFCPNSVGVLQGPGEEELTSGYFVLPALCLALINPLLIYACATTYCDDIPHPGKCRHGIEETFCPGINKDEKGRPFYEDARRQAETATIHYLEQLLNDRFITENPNKVDMIKALMGISTSETGSSGDLVIVIDDTGSMGNDIAQVKAEVASIVEGGGTPKKFVLVRFGDPIVGLPFTTNNATQFLEKINQVTPNGGGDCPEKSMTGLLRAVEASSKNSNIYFFTDADAKDSSLASQVITKANEKNIPIFGVITGSCTRRRGLVVRGARRLAPDQAYFRVTEETGGQLFEVDRSEVNTVFDFLRPQLSGDFVTLLRASGSLSSSPEEFSIPIDSTITTAVISVTYEASPIISFERPDGSSVFESDENVTVTNQAKGIFYTITNPVAGIWSLSVSGIGGFNVLAKASSPLQLSSFKFVEPKVTHGGLAYEALKGQPVIGTFPTGLAHVIGPYISVDFRLVDKFGDSIETIDLSLGDPLAAEDKWSGNFTLPLSPFRVVAFGTDSKGEKFERVYPELFYAQGVAIDIPFNETVVYLPYNETTTTVKFEVQNFKSNPVTFEMVASDDRSYISRTGPSFITIGANSSEFYEVELLSPSAEDCVQDLRETVTVTATNSMNPDMSNSYTVLLYTDCNFALADDVFEMENTGKSKKKSKSMKKGKSKSKMQETKSPEKMGTKGKRKNLFN